MIDFDKFDLWKLRCKAQSQSIEAGASHNDALASFSERFTAALFDPTLAMPVVRHDAWLHESFQNAPQRTRWGPSGAGSEQTIVGIG